MQQLSSLQRRPAACRALARRARPAPQGLARHAPLRAAAAAADRGAESISPGRAGDLDLDDQVEQFMKRQAELESGAAFARTRDPAQIIGGDVVNGEEAKGYCREVVGFLQTLKETRDMTVNEAKLVIAIEDPRTRERRNVGIEDERGVSRDEMAAALEEVARGTIPRDRLALKCLYEDMRAWPYLQGIDAANAAAKGAAAAAAAATAAAAAGGGGAAAAAAAAAAQDPYAELNADNLPIAKPYIMGRDARAGDSPQTVTDLLPDWVGFGALYGISAIPVLLVVGTVLILFFNSLR